MVLEWVVTSGLTPYPAAVAEMEARVAMIRAGEAAERIWLVEHPPVYTAGVAARTEHLLEPRFPIFETGRGGKHTYHGPGQRVVYPMLDLAARGPDLHRYVSALEAWVIAALARLGVPSATRVAGMTGVWVDGAKIAAIGVRVRRWVSYHGLAINVEPELSHFAGIVPCGLDRPVTSLAALGVPATLSQVDAALEAALPEMLGLLGDEHECATSGAPVRSASA